MKKHRLRKLLVYIYMPIIFAVIGYGIVYIAAKPVIEVGISIGSLFLSGTGKNADDLKGKTFKSPEVTDINAQKATISMGDIHWPEWGDIYGQLSCERIGLAGDVYYGDDNEILRTGIGQFMGSGIPGDGYQILLAGHNTTIFSPLQAIVPGDVVNFTTTYGVYQYQITETKVLNAGDTSAYNLLEEGEQLVMYTCYPFTALGSTNERFFVYGSKLTGPDIVPKEGQ